MEKRVVSHLGKMEERILDRIDYLIRNKDLPSVLWGDLHDILHTELVETIEEIFGK